MDSIQNPATAHQMTMEEAIRLLMTNGYIVTEPNTLSLSQRVEELESKFSAKSISDHLQPVSGGKDTPVLTINTILTRIEEEVNETESCSWRLGDVVNGFVGHEPEPIGPEGMPSPCSSLNERLMLMLTNLSRTNRRFRHNFERLDKGFFG